MKPQTIILTLILIFAFCTCSGHKKADSGKNGFEIAENEPGDSTLYGLACDGTNDSIIKILPYDLSDPQEYSIIPAFRSHKVFGIPTTGSNIAVILSADKKAVECVINIDRLCGKWCYEVLPEMQKPASMDDIQFGQFKKRFLANMTDSMKNAMFKPMEYFMELNHNKTAHCSGEENIVNEDDKIQLIKYPQPKFYNGWKLYNGHLILTADRPTTASDTCDFEIRRHDTLTIHFNDKIQKYYRKQENESH